MNKKKNHKKLITAIILTYNEEKHISRCINSVLNFVEEIVVIDSGSNDKTIDIVNSIPNTRLVKNKFINQAKQINWALDNLEFKTDWLFRIDADEHIDLDFVNEISNFLKLNQVKFDGISVLRKLIFFKKEISYGGQFPHKTVRLWKKNKGRSQDLWMDEQISVDGKVYNFDKFIIDENLNDLKWWINKHKKYAQREALSFFLVNDKNTLIKKPSDKSKNNKYYKYKIYYKMPMFIRPLALFIYNYIYKLGFLCGWQGLVYYIIQMIWYRFLTDLNIYKIKSKMKNQNKSLSEVIKSIFSYEI